MKRLATMQSMFAAIALCLAGQVHAATYTVEEALSGTFSVMNVGIGSFETSHALTLDSLISGETVLFTSKVESFVTSRFDSQLGLTLCSGACTFTETLLSGEMIFGDVSFTHFSVSLGGLQTSYSGLLQINGGTGRFVGASGSGTFNGIDTYLTATSGTTQHHSAFTVTTVPEPVTYSLMLAGLIVLSRARRSA